MLNIPDDKLPNEWKDEARINSLFSPFRDRNVNPRDWDTKIASWKNIISLYCANNAVYSFTLSLLNKIFIRNGRPPSCLATVVEQLVKSGELNYLEGFLKTDSHQTWSGWAADLLIKKPISWSYNSLRRSLFTPKVNPEQVYVNVEVIRSEANKLFAEIPEEHRNKVINFNQLLKITKRNINQAQDIQLLLHQLAKDSKISIIKLETKSDNNFNSFLIKFGEIRAEPITETEISTYVLQQDAKIFEKHIEELEDEILKLISQAKNHLTTGHRQSAKTCLRRKKEVEKRLEKKANALCNIETLLQRLKDAQTDGKVLESYKFALNAFNQTYKEKGLNEEAVEDTMNQVADVLDLQEDIEAALARPLHDVDADLEDELNELLQNEQDENNANGGGGKLNASEEELEKELIKLKLDELPQVPTADLSTTSREELSFM